MHLQRKLEVSKLPDVEIKTIKRNRILTDLTIRKINNTVTPNTVFKLPYLDKTNVQGTKRTVSPQSISWLSQETWGNKNLQHF